ncbi:unnamed protein product [Dibothriocephalus latus]|uniref:GOLD domain-containing protein n=1 Tax=Dibothriocephalus latus TaxID=60516 RepID=A0A3P7LH39_DIBLA|nr:unnamed protein product [Dibothriocephalus latus]
MLRSVALLVVCCSVFVSGYYVTVDANGEECYFDRLKAGAKFVLHFEVSEGGFYDIDVKISGPDNNVLYSVTKESSGRYAMTASKDGIYTYCFSNKMSTMTPKVVLFALEVEDKQLEKEAGASEEQNKLVDMVNELASSVMSAKHEMEYLEVRETLHRAINENTNSRVVLWAAFEALIIVGMSLGQVYYLKRFFEVRRMV